MDVSAPLRAACWLAAAVCAAAPVQAATDAASPPPPDCEQARRLPAEAGADARRIVCTIPPQYRADVSRAELLGRLLRRHDVAAWLTSDALLEIGALQRPPGEGLGWLTHDTGQAVQVRYFARGPEPDSAATPAPVAFAQALLPLRAPLRATQARRLDPPQPADARERRLLAALALAHRQPRLQCSDAAPNTVAFGFDHDGEPAQILVFLMTPWQRDLPLGGHALFRISAEGDRIIDRYEQTRSCLDLPAQSLKQAQALTVSHSTSAAPTFFHVFMSLQYDKPLIVHTTQNGLLWKIEDGRVGRLPKRAPEAGAAQAWARDRPAVEAEAGEGAGRRAHERGGRAGD